MNICNLPVSGQRARYGVHWRPFEVKSGLNFPLSMRVFEQDPLRQSPGLCYRMSVNMSELDQFIYFKGDVFHTLKPKLV
jgi:hypothetical protein